MTEAERLEAGRKTFKDVHGDVLKLPEKIDPQSFQGHVLRDVYNDVWGRKKMSNRDRRLVVLGALAAQSLQFPLETHMKCAIELGEIGPEEVNEMLYILSIYIGFPRTTMFAETAHKLLPGKL